MGNDILNKCMWNWKFVGEIYTNKTVELRQDQQILTLVVTAQDGGNPRLSAVVAINLQVIPVNKYAPEFPQQQTKYVYCFFTVKEE